MKAKKSLQERVERMMCGCSHEEAEQIAVGILAQLMAKAVWIDNNGEEFLLSISEKICQNADKWAQDHSKEIAIARSRKGSE